MSILPLRSPEDTLTLGACLGPRLQAGDVVALWGELGAGKTTLARGVITTRHPDTFAPSPTFALVHTYDWGKTQLWHVDLYRLEGTPPDLGLEEADGILLIEWPQRLGADLELWAARVDIHLEETHNTERTARLKGHGRRAQSLVAQVAAAWKAL